ncbi:hypothetical protein COO59_16335 [Mixta theicola]|uniref:3-octaprenyl-4-hydroxybenzoate carboxy-lyase n=1 Tax=Mixta theicola TaxID=1458355 RepID=A0A2K1Q6P6_9GAMM|nr:UbiD family decarboxylase [Mixta theicola]PNS10681.1 hypothetical protein COO59_16335 [Mixta theicola]GLR10931.1 3,4-dihydroxybenzoate decarboxylase [Mixta theicola]
MMKNDLRSVLSKLSAWGISPCFHNSPLSPRLEISEHYNNIIATVPGSSRTGHENMFMYECKEYSIPVLIGLFGNRIINQKIIDEYCLKPLNTYSLIPPDVIDEAACHQHKIDCSLNKLPILKLTSYDAGAYITSGVICAQHIESQKISSSIHRLKVINENQLALAMRPTGFLFECYHNALKNNKTLPVTINIGIPPIYYLLTSLSSNFLQENESKLEKIGGLTGYPVLLTKAKTQNNAYCYADSEIVIEGEITSNVIDECNLGLNNLSMPEFIGYMGEGKKELPVINITGIYHKENPIYQTFMGPGKEQSELLSISTEIDIKIKLREKFFSLFNLIDAHYPSFGGGQLVLILKIEKKLDCIPLCDIQKFILSIHPLCKHIYLVDNDIDIYSPEDIFWAFSTRFQPSRDMNIVRLPGWNMDPSQLKGYLDDKESITESIIFDLTSPYKLTNYFKRFFNLDEVYSEYKES